MSPARASRLVGGLGVEVDLARAQISERDGLDRRSRCRRTPCSAAGIAREQRDARLVLARGDVLDRDRLDDHRCDAVDEPRCRRPRGRCARRSPPGSSGRRSPRCSGRERRVDAAAATISSARPSAADGRRADRLAHRVARRERGGDDRRAEHRAGDDQRACGRAPTGVAHAEAEEARGCARPSTATTPSATHERGDEDDEHGADRDAEERCS